MTLDTVLLTERERDPRQRAAHRADTYKEREQTERERGTQRQIETRGPCLLHVMEATEPTH